MKTKFFATAVAMTIGLLGVQPAQAYDVDTHFYGTYAMARFVGIKHEVAAQIAAGTQWMDESYISDPMSMILLPDFGVKKRRLLHFPGTRTANALSPDILPPGLWSDPSSGKPLKAFTETLENDDMATEMLTEGLIQGDLMKASVGLHTLEDSFAHAGTISELGHFHFWHHPDRPFADEDSIAKYFRMTHTVIRALVAIRTMLPESALDKNTKVGSAVENYLLDAETLAALYQADPRVRATVTDNILKEPNYVGFVLQNIFARASAKKANYIQGNYGMYLNRYQAGDDAYTAALEVATNMPTGLINMQKVAKDTGLTGDIKNPDYVTSEDGPQALIKKAINELMTDIVPRPLNVDHRFEKEEDGDIRNYEMATREWHMRLLIANLFHDDILFVPNNSSDFKGMLAELRQDPSARQKMPARQGANTKLVTFTLQEKAKFDYMIFTFLMPKLAGYLDLQTDFKVLADIIEIKQKAVNEEVAAMKELQKERLDAANAPGVVKSVLNFMGTMAVDSWELAVAGEHIAAEALDAHISLPKIKHLARMDIEGARLQSNPLNKYYANPQLLKKMLNQGKFKRFSEDQIVNLPRSAEQDTSNLP